MKGKPKKGSSGGSTLTVPLMLVAAIFAGFFFVIYIMHMNHISAGDVLNATSNKFIIVERENTDRIDPDLRVTEAPVHQDVTGLLTNPIDVMYITTPGGWAVKRILDQHPFHSLSPAQRSQMSLEDHFVYLSNQSVCNDTPIFTSMANVFSDLYWQL